MLYYKSCHSVTKSSMVYYKSCYVVTKSSMLYYKCCYALLQIVQLQMLDGAVTIVTRQLHYYESCTAYLTFEVASLICSQSKNTMLQNPAVLQNSRLHSWTITSLVALLRMLQSTITKSWHYYKFQHC